MFYEMIGQMKKQLRQLDLWLEAATTFAKSKGFEADVLVGMRLAPDQFPFSRQVQSSCDTAKLSAARLTGKEAPKNDDGETTIAQLRERVAGTLQWLDTLTAKDFEGAAERSITQPRWEGKTMSGADYFREHAIPNFYFHVSHCYAILRHNGVGIGKRDYLGQMTMRDAAK